MNDEKKEEKKPAYKLNYASITGTFSVNEMFRNGEGKETKEIYHGIVVSWGAEGLGFGELTIRAHEDGKVTIDSEMMSKDFIKEVLCKIVDDSKTDLEK